MALIANAAAAILAGGAGRRLGGATKALLEVQGRPILERQLDVLRPLFADVLVVANDPAPFARFGLPVVPDRLAGRGAPGGLHAALCASPADWVFCLGSDMPFPSEAAIGLLASSREGHDAVAFERHGHLEPLFAFYSRGLLPGLEAALLVGSPSFARLLQAVRLARVPASALHRLGPGARCLLNVNTPDDLARIGR